MIAQARTTLTAAEFEAVCDQLGPCELVRGEVAGPVTLNGSDSILGDSILPGFSTPVAEFFAE